VTSRRSGYLLFLVLAALCAVLALPGRAAAEDGDDRRDVRRTGVCTGSSETNLRVRADDGTIRVELEIETEGRSGSRWTAILLHERRTAFRGVLRARRGSTVRLRRTVPDWFGLDTVVARATGPRRETCRVSVTV
jgi:hypothetical protein